MIEKNFKKKTSWKNWLIKKLITSEASKEEILNFIIKDDENKQIYEFQDNNEKNLMKNILNLNNKSVENIMVSRAEIVAVEKNQSIDKILLIFGKKAHFLQKPPNDQQNFLVAENDISDPQLRGFVQKPWGPILEAPGSPLRQ